MANPTTPITIKKYANRRLYNTASSAYVTLADLAKMVKNGEDFVVYDAKTNEEITRSVLAQIIFEQEGIEGQSLLPITFLRQLIRFYGDSVQALLPSYLEYSIDQFTGEKQAMREAMRGEERPSAIDHMNAMADRMAKVSANIKAIAGAAKPLFDSLDETQKHHFGPLLMTLIERGPHEGHMAGGWDKGRGEHREHGD